MRDLCEKLGYSFRDSKLLETALTHPSFGGDHHVPHYQRLEFLGDAVLELAVSDFLYRELPGVDEGKLTRIRAALVREETLYAAARRIDLGRFVRLSVGEERSGGRDKPSILSDVMEAVFAAVYLDGGFDCAVKVVARTLGAELRPQALADHLDAKSRLQELLQREGEMPEYEFISTQRSTVAPVFHYRARAGGRAIGEGSGSSKQSAQQAAARDALKRMGALS